MNRIEVIYLPWLLKFVADERLMERYQILFHELYSTPFNHRGMKEHDFDRSMDGKNLRWRFERTHERDISHISAVEFMEFEDRQCSMLEMLIALALRIEEGMTADTRQGDRTGQWFWEMLTNLGIGYMSDIRFDKSTYKTCIDRFHSYSYTSEGKGCLFRAPDKTINDMKNLDIWYQMCAHVNEVLNIK